MEKLEARETMKTIGANQTHNLLNAGQVATA